MELSKGEYALTTMMPTKKDIFGNQTKHYMCWDYRPIMNKQTCLYKYVMPLPKEIFNALGEVKVLNILDLKSSYHQLPLKMGDKVNTTFRGINPHGKDCLYFHGNFCHSI